MRTIVMLDVVISKKEGYHITSTTSRLHDSFSYTAWEELPTISETKEQITGVVTVKISTIF